MKKLWAALIVLLISLCVVGTVVAAEIGTYKGFKTVKIYIDGQQVTSDVPAIIMDGRTLVPLRVISETLGANISWNPSEKSVSINSASAVETLNLSRDDEQWLIWSQAADEREQLLDKYNALLDTWDGENQSVLKQLIALDQETIAVLENTPGPPGAEWYRDGLIAYDQKFLQSDNLFLKALGTSNEHIANELIRKATALKDEADAYYDDLDTRWENWLQETGQS